MLSHIHDSADDPPTVVCVACAQPIADTRLRYVTANRRVPAKRYCGAVCAKRAAYLRRKQRALSELSPTPGPRRPQ